MHDWLASHGQSKAHDRWYAPANLTLVAAVALQKVLGGEVCVVQKLEGPKKDEWYEWPWVNKQGVLRLGVLYLDVHGAQSFGDIYCGDRGTRVIGLAETWVDVEAHNWETPPDMGNLAVSDQLSCELATALRQDFSHPAELVGWMMGGWWANRLRHSPHKQVRV